MARPLLMEAELLSIVAVEDLDQTQFDFWTSLVHGLLDKEIYIIHLPYFEDSTCSNHIC
jgi:hypothetical protein